MKKKRQLIITAILMLFVLTAAGCGNDKEDQLEEEVARLEQQVNDLQKENDLKKETNLQTQTEAQTEAQKQSETQMETKSDELTNTEAVTEGTKQEQTDFATLESEVNAQVEKAAAEVVDSEESKKVEQYFSIKREIEQLDQKLDMHDDYLESQYHQKSLTFEELKSQERALDTLENKLDEAEDQLEIRFGIDD